MPRVTRATQKNIEVLEDAASVPLPSTPRRERAPLGEITANQNENTPVRYELEVDIYAKPPKKTGAKGRKAKGTKKGKKKDIENSENNDVLEDDNQSDVSSAVEEACKELMKENNGAIHDVPIHDPCSRTPPSKAVKMATKRLSLKPSMPKLDLNSQTQEMENKMVNLNLSVGKEDSFVENISSRSPVKMSDMDVFVDKDTPIKSVEPAEEVSFSEQIISRSPIKRIEDSVEAIDALEDAIEKIGESLPALPDSPVKRSTRTRKVITKSLAGSSTASASKALFQAAKRDVVRTQRPETERRAPVTRVVPKPTLSQVRISNVKQASTTKPLGRSRPSTITQSSSPSKVQHSSSTPNATGGSSLVKPKRHIRVSAVIKPPFVPQKSTKEPTRPVFSLPGDAVAQKLKIQREERVKKEEEEAAKKTFKARPAPRLSSVPVVKETAASRARLSLVPSGNVISGKPVTRFVGKVNLASTTGSLRANGMQTLRRQPAPRQTAADLFSSTPKGSTTTRSVSATLTGKRAVSNNSDSTDSTVVHTILEGSTKPKVKVSGKEVFNRTKSIQDAALKEKKEKEEAAKRARKEAAEKGRAASRAWAERKLKAKEAAANGGAPVPVGEAAVAEVAASVESMTV
ncbi:MAG: hypothetical protein MMC33_005378 [Icmadophila ericetorum]|nr:hypothetical protein [Icmadophila ericetorum]